MPISPFRLKQYLRLLINYIRYDFAILFYILLVLTSVFFTIMTLVHTEINRNLLSYGGLDEAETSYAVNLGLNSTQKELLYLLELLEPYNLTEINDIWIGLPLIYPRGAAALNPPIDDSELDGRGFTEQELIDGKNVIILSGEDYLTYFQHSAIGDMLPIYGTEFQLIGISYSFSLPPSVLTDGIERDDVVRPWSIGRHHGIGQIGQKNRKHLNDLLFCAIIHPKNTFVKSKDSKKDFGIIEE